MSTEFFYKKAKFCAFLSAVLFTVFCLLYAFSLTKAHAVRVDANVYFVVSKNESASVGAELMKLDGGAGYLLADGEEEYAVWSVYFNEEDGKSLQNRLQEKGLESELVFFSMDTLYFQTLGEKKGEKATIELLGVVKSCMQILNQTISRLERGMTQQKTKSLLSILSKQLAFAGRKYAHTTGDLASVCQESAKRLDVVREGMVYSDKLTYELCFLADGYLSSCKRFVL